MKAYLVFNLNDVDDRAAHIVALKAEDMAFVLSEIRQRMLRPARKHGYSDIYLNTVNEKYPELFSKLEDMFNEICEEYNVTEYT